MDLAVLRCAGVLVYLFEEVRDGAEVHVFVQVAQDPDVCTCMLFLFVLRLRVVGEFLIAYEADARGTLL